ncbi:Lipid A export ATP-binding/permease protein MsbA [Nocardioides aquaticus]|uniref:Lipid A export ATP-binding/permease protein MsbA n=1 Tax=Nocardioides aquaticus TaxID=160826 RepID=A0ABX8ED05_9ACTN|nr:ABC transporter ATP-binding protein [Nocardioides aquaticus]QVT78279.1 Lipid A export ATP-binding/permease protein MsbA [Nocardioides aquaticus]
MTTDDRTGGSPQEPPARPLPDPATPRAGLLARAAASLRPGADDDPMVAQARGMTIADVVRRFWPRLRPLRGWLVLGLVLLAAAPAITVAETLLFQQLVDQVLVPADPGPLLWLALVFLGLNLLSGVVSGADDYLGTWISQKFLVGLRRDSFAHVLSQPSLTHDRRRMGDVLTRLTSDVSAVESFMVGQLTVGIGAVLQLVFSLGALFYLQWQLALASLVVVPVFWWVSTRFARLTKDVSRERRRRGGSLSSVTEESLANASLVQGYGREADAVASYQRQNEAIASAELAGSRVRAVFLPLVDLAELAGMLLVIGLGVWALATDRLTLGGLLAFLTLLITCYKPVRELSQLVPALFSATAGVERIVELLDEPAAGDRPGATPLPAPVTGTPRGGVELRSVSYTYPDAASPVLDGLDLVVRPGERVALVGPSGTGKSTVARLLTRALDPEAGRVLLDGHDLAERTATSVRAAVTVVHQEQLMLDASVHDNIAFSRPDATRAEVEAAARAADAHDFVARMPQGYDSRVGQRGRSLSGGQRQRLALARALLRESRLLVLDEPTTGLDEATSRRLLEAVLRGPGDHAVLLLTHDAVALEYVDRVIDLAADPATPPVPPPVPPPVSPPAAPVPA